MVSGPYFYCCYWQKCFEVLDQHLTTAIASIETDQEPTVHSSNVLSLLQEPGSSLNIVQGKKGLDQAGSLSPSGE